MDFSMGFLTALMILAGIGLAALLPYMILNKIFRTVVRTTKKTVRTVRH